MADKHDDWFPARRLGWGWGLPTAWQGLVAICWLKGEPPRWRWGK